jgi:hypothetical protein
MLAKQDDGAIEVRIGQLRHRDEKGGRERGHGSILLNDDTGVGGG